MPNDPRYLSAPGRQCCCSCSCSPCCCHGVTGPQGPEEPYSRRTGKKL
ncbi:MAG: hypothetical protein FWH26_03965 [Oscillospiraceae bacterium]|nr:hypothetical protein [Oscillospiraceae bacterium]